MTEDATFPKTGRDISINLGISYTLKILDTWLMSLMLGAVENI